MRFKEWSYLRGFRGGESSTKMTAERNAKNSTVFFFVERNNQYTANELKVWVNENKNLS